jgi:hypothetical protein
MLKDIVDVKVLDGYKLWLKFEDGIEGDVDISALVRFEGIFAPLKDQQFFKSVKLAEEVGTICWSNGADLDPDVLYAEITRQAIPDFHPTLSNSKN